LIARLLIVLRSLLLAGLVIAMARPRSSGRQEQSNSEGINIVVAFDISSSMLAEDFQPQNRLEVARDKVKQFIAMRASDRIGVVAFSGEALTQVPLTTDYSVVQAAVDNLQPGQLEDGTAIGTAIATSANRLRDAPGRSRVIVLLTDGVNNRGSIDPRTAAQAAAAFGIKIYAIGVGSEGMAPVPVGRGVFGLRYENRPVEIDDALLSEIAQRTGGRYFRARDAAALERITEEIDRLERTPVRMRVYTRYAELYRWPLALALVALVLEIGLAAWRGPVP
jgi:Ca-activated chloride channel family protein